MSKSVSWYILVAILIPAFLFSAACSKVADTVADESQTAVAEVSPAQALNNSNNPAMVMFRSFLLRIILPYHSGRISKTLIMARRLK